MRCRTVKSNSLTQVQPWLFSDENSRLILACRFQAHNALVLENYSHFPRDFLNSFIFITEILCPPTTVPPFLSLSLWQLHSAPCFCIFYVYDSVCFSPLSPEQLGWTLHHMWAPSNTHRRIFLLLSPLSLQPFGHWVSLHVQSRISEAFCAPWPDYLANRSRKGCPLIDSL